jgi:hypothetical protein
MNTMKLCLALFAVLFISCYRPYFEKAEIKEGTSIGFGVGVTTCPSTTDGSGIYNIWDDYCLAGTGTLFFRHGFSEKRQLFIQLSGGTGWLLRKEYPDFIYRYGIPFVYDIQAGMKFKIGQKGAIRTSVGFPNVFDLTYLYDYNPALTQNLSIGGTGVGIGLVFHHKLSDKLVGHISINYSQNIPWPNIPLYRPSIFLGYGIEWF